MVNKTNNDSKDMTVSVGVVGMGKMGLLHASIVNTIPGARVVAMYEKNALLTRYASRALGGIRVTNRMDEFARGRFDAVYVTTPIRTHFSVVEEILSRGLSKNIFVEKTLASTYEQSKQLSQRTQALGAVTMVGYMNRFASTFMKARELIKTKAMGNVISFNAYAYASDFADPRVKALPTKGGALRDLGSHIIDISLWYFGDLRCVSAQPRTPDSNDNDVHFGVAGDRGLVGTFDISWFRKEFRLPEYGMTIEGSSGKIIVTSDFVRLENESGSAVWYRQTLNDTVPFLLGAPEYYREDEHFVTSVRNGEAASPDFQAASAVDCVIDQFERQGIQPR